MADPLYGRKIPRRVFPLNNFVLGISDYEKSGGSYIFGRSIDYRTDPRKLTILPAAVKESQSITLGLPKWGERLSADNNTYIYDNVGNFYKRTSAGVHSLLRTVASSHGNGMKYFGEDDFTYYASDKLIGRYGPMSGTPTFTDDYFGSTGGVPTNSYSTTLVAASSQYYTAADSASLSITSDIALEAYVKLTTLPTVGNSMTIIGKWDESGTTMSYKMDIYAVSGYFGDGSNGALTISVDTTDSPIDSACTGTSGAYSLAATNVSFAAGQVILIHQTQGTGAGTYQRTTIQSYSAGTITTTDPLNANYTSGAQVIVMKQYSAVTVNSGKTWTAKAWNGTVGGILAFLCSGTITITGSISASGKGFRGATGSSSATQATQGEGSAGAGGASVSANGNGGGGGNYASGPATTGGGGGGNGTAGSNGGPHDFGTFNSNIGIGGSTIGAADLTTMDFGGGGGAGAGDSVQTGGTGGNGGGIVFASGTTITISGSIVSGGTNGAAATGNHSSGGGAGAGGSVLLKAQTATLGTTLITASGGTGGTHDLDSNNTGGNGGDGRVHLDYYTSYTGTTTPTITVLQDNSLVTNTTYQLRYGVSSNGSVAEYLGKAITISTGTWTRLGISWVASTSICTFYVNGINVGTTTGTKTAIHDNASLLYVGANKTSVVANFLNGLMDDVRVWGATRTDSQMALNKDVELLGTEGNLKAYYKLNNAVTDLTANTNDLTQHNTPTFTTDVPFSNATTRNDIDQTGGSTGNTTTLTAAIDESASSKYISFVPAKDPQKSMDVNIASKGTGSWVFTLHDGLNRVIATSTVTIANLNTGFYEIVWSTPWRPVIGATYHLHITQSTADGTTVCTTSSNLSTTGFHTYYQFLVTDVDFHPIERMLNLIGIGNERYLATYDASSYNPMRLKFPAGWRVRCLARWHEYFAIGCWKGTNITDFDEGIIFFWDGYSTTYNFFIDVPEGGINAMLSTKGKLHVWAGYKGEHLIYTGGDTADKVKRIPKVTDATYVELFPGAVTMWQSLIRYGVAGNSDSTVVEKGVYSWGSRNIAYADSLSYDFPISTGNRLSTVKIGMLTVVDKKLLIGWQDGAAFGVDVVNLAGNPYTTATIEGPIIDIGAIWKEKQAVQLRADFPALITGQSIDIKYKLDRETNWHNALSITGITQAVGDTQLRFPLVAPAGRHKEIQIAADLTGPGTSAPTLTELSLDEDFLLDEQQP